MLTVIYDPSQGKLASLHSREWHLCLILSQVKCNTNTLLHLQCEMPVPLLIVELPLKYNPEVLADFADLLQVICLDCTKVIVCGDLNIHSDSCAQYSSF